MTSTDKLAEARTWHDSPEWQAEVDRMERVEANKPTEIPPCPEWCELPAGHRYDSTLMEDEETYTRNHEALNGGALLVAQEERNRHGVVDLGKAQILVQAPDYITAPDTAVAAARELLVAADLLEKINGRVVASAFRMGYAAAQETAGCACTECGQVGQPLRPREVTDEDGVDTRIVWECVDSAGCFGRLREQSKGQQ